MRGLDLFKEMSKEELQQLWSETMGDEPFPMNRSENSPLDSFYPIDNFIVFMKEGKPISGVGYSTRDGFSLRGGAFTIPDERGSGVYSKVSQEADRIIPTPYIAGFSSSNISSKEWNQKAKERGWSIKPTDEELGEYANNPTIKAFKDYYDNHPKGSSWGVKGLPLKKWFSILKSYRIQMGKAGYNVLDASGKVLNYKGLSRSQARAFVKDLQEGKDVSRFTTKPRKSIRGDWFNQLKKWLPDDNFEIDTDEDGEEIIWEDTKDNPSPYYYDSNRNIYIRPHYINVGRERTQMQSYANSTDMIDEWISKIYDKNITSNGAWFYANDKSSDLSYVFVRKASGDAKLLGSKNLKNKKPTPALIFDTFRGRIKTKTSPFIGRPESGFLDIWGTGIKAGHKEGQFIANSEPPQETAYSNAQTSDEVYEVFSVIRAKIEDKIKTATNRRDGATNPETKEKANKEIDKLKTKLNNEYKKYKRIHREIGDI